MSAGYSGTPLPRKLGIGEGAALALVDEPDGAETLLETLPDGARITPDPAEAEVVLAFATTREVLTKHVERLAPAVFPDRTLWVAWPKRASKVPTDITEDVVREIALANRLVDNKVCAIDEVWSGLRLVIRVKDRLPS